jgi:uncharacterized protein
MGIPALLLVLGLLLSALGAAAAESVAIPPLKSRVTDLTGTLDPNQKAALDARLAALDRPGGAQGAILLLPTTQPETIEAYGIRLAEAWKLGHKGDKAGQQDRDNGFIIVVAKDDRKTRIEVGYGLEGTVPDAIARRIIDERMTPAFRAGKFDVGLDAGLDGIVRALGAPGQTPLEPEVTAATGGTAMADEELLPWLATTALGAGVLRMLFGVIGALVAAAAGGWLGLLVFGSWLAGAIAAVVVFLLSFVNVLSGGRGGGGWSSGGSSGGGFSGGGGSFGGGGASGSW